MTTMRWIRGGSRRGRGGGALPAALLALLLAGGCAGRAPDTPFCRAAGEYRAYLGDFQRLDLLDKPRVRGTVERGLASVAAMRDAAPEDVRASADFAREYFGAFVRKLEAAGWDLGRVKDEEAEFLSDPRAVAANDALRSAAARLCRIAMTVTEG